MNRYTTNAIDALTVEHLGPDASEADLAHFQDAARNYHSTTGATPDHAVDAIWGNGDYYERACQWTTQAFISGYEDAHEAVTVTGPTAAEPAGGWDTWAITIEGLTGFTRDRLDAPYSLHESNPAEFARLRTLYATGARLAVQHCLARH